MKKLPYIHVMVGAGVILVAGAIIAYAVTMKPKAPTPASSSISNFEECAAAGNPVMESYPRQCRANGQLFVEQVGAGGTIPAGRGPSGGCVPAGCSSTICVDESEAANIVTTCEYRSEYACYKLTTCERQADDTCGWTKTDAFSTCLSNPPVLE